MEEVPIIEEPVQANQWTGFYMIGTSGMKELNVTSATKLFVAIK